MSRLIWISLIWLVALSVHAEIKANKDWFWDTSKQDFAYAATANDEGHILGQYCYYANGTCVYVVTLGIKCSQGAEYPALINSNIGAMEVRLVCGHKTGNEYAFYLKSFKSIDDAVRQARYLGFAVAMDSGKFKVVRFSLSGSTYAIEMMRALASQKGPSNEQDNPGSGMGGNSRGSDQYL